MNACIQNYTVPIKERDFDNTVLSLRLTSVEAVRFWRIMDDAKSRNPYVGKSDVYRELFGLAKPVALTAEEIKYFRTGEKGQSIAEVKDFGTAPDVGRQPPSEKPMTAKPLGRIPQKSSIKRTGTR